MRSKRVLALAVPALCLAAAPNASAGHLGILTADVEMSIPNVFLDPFPAVINPDGDHPDKIMPTNDSGVFTGALDAPDSFAYTDLPVYAVVNQFGQPWDYADPLFAEEGPQRGQDFSSPNFNLVFIGALSLSLTHQGGGLYDTSGGSYYDDVNDVSYPVAGDIQFSIPPFGMPNFVWYGMDDNSINLFETAKPVGFSASSNDDLWTTGWPGATLDKNFYPPAPGTLALLAIAGGILTRRRR